MATYGFCQCVFDRQQLSPDEDVAVVTSHFRRVDNNLPDIFPIIDGTREDYRDNWLSFWSEIKGHVTPKVVFREMRMYNVPAAVGDDMGDPVVVYPVNEPGSSGTGCLPPQVSLSVTFKTQHRLRWGRFYVPGITPNNLDNNGRWDDFIVGNIANAAHHLTGRAGSGGSLTVFSRKYWNHEDPLQIQVDDIPDIIRRRRFSQPILKTVVDAG
jgi:hypothetical protein